MSTTKAVQESGVTEDMVTAAQEDLKQMNEERKQADNIRTFRPGGVASKLHVSKLFPFPKDFSLDNISPTSYLAQPEGDITGSVATQRFSIIEDRLKGLLFDQPGRPLAAGRALRTVKWLKRDGTLTQVGFEGQLNNTGAGNDADALGLRLYQRKGGLLFFDFESGLPTYCFARNCWAAAMIDELAKEFPQHANVVNSGYCSADHFRYIEPSKARRWFQEGGGIGNFETNATTSQSYYKKA